MTVKTKITTLRNIIARLSEAYYAGRSLVSDTDFDNLILQLRDLEDANPDLANPDSPTQTVGGNARTFNVVRHARPCLSLNSTSNIDEVYCFLQSVGCEVVIEEKIDGLTMVATYRNGKLLTLATRGDGIIGDNVTRNRYVFKNLPFYLPNDCSVRGEAYITYSDFARVNLERVKRGEAPFKSPRDAASAILQMKDAGDYDDTLEFRAFEVISDRDRAVFVSHEMTRELLEDFGFTMTQAVTPSRSINNIIKRLDALNADREAADYPTDGVVFKAANATDRRRLGETRNAPRWALAFKAYPIDRTKETSHEF